MRRWTTLVIVTGVVAVAVLAAADALRGHGELKTTSESPTIARPVSQRLEDILRREAITGFVVYSDHDCVLHSLLLPRMLDEVVRTDANQPFRMCRFSSGGGRYLPEGQLASPDERLVAECQGGHIAVWELESGIPKRSLRGCPPAWRPDGRLTYPQGSRIMAGNRVLFSAADLREAARLHPNIAGLDPSVQIFVHATDLAWLDETHMVTTLAIRVPNLVDENLAVLFSGKEVTAVAVNVGRGSGPGNWVVSPAGNFAASENGIIVRRDGGSIDPPQTLPGGRAVAFSPDEQWLAYITSASIYLIETPRNSEPQRIIRLPVGAQDLVWEPAGVTTGTSTVVR
jgi:hypothetical protein